MTGKSTVVYPNEPSESDIQFHVMYRLRNMGLDVHAEVFSRKKLGCRLDLVVFVDKDARLIIECKKKKAKSIHPKYRQREITRCRKQSEKYETLGLPIDWIIGMKEANEYIANFKARHPDLFIAM